MSKLSFAAGLMVCLSACCQVAQASQPTTIAYRNARWDFRLNYPAGWATDEGGDGAGILLTLAGQAIAFGALYMPEDDAGQPQLGCSQVSDVDPLISRGRKAVTGKRLVGRKQTHFHGLPACVERWRFAVNGTTYVGEYTSVFRHGLKYDFSLECPLASCTSTRRAYARTMNTFRYGHDQN